MMRVVAKKGQAVIIVLLVLVVVLTVGLSIAARTVTDVKLSQQTEMSSRAFNAAEAGIESYLQNGATGANIVGTDLSTSPSYNVGVITVGGDSSAFIFNKPIAKDDTQQVWLIGHKSDGSLGCTDTDGSTSLKCFNSKNLTVYWGNSTQADNTETTPALEVSVIYKDSGGNYKIAKGAFDNSSSPHIASNNFSTANVSEGAFLAPNNFKFKVSLDLSIAPFSIANIGSGTTLYALRLRLLYNTTDPQILAAQPTNPGDTFPVQGKLISSTGQVGNIVRKVQVFESYPSLAPIFDYVIFNGSSNSLQK